MRMAHMGISMKNRPPRTDYSAQVAGLTIQALVLRLTACDRGGTFGSRLFARTETLLISKRKGNAHQCTHACTHAMHAGGRQ